MQVVFQSPSFRQRIANTFRGFDKILVFILLFICMLSLIIMFSAGYDHGTRVYGHARNIGIALFIAFIIGQMSPQQISRIAVPLYCIGVLLLIAVALFGVTKKGSTRWLDIGITVIQPSEFLKLGMPLMLAWWFQFREGHLGKSDFLLALVILIVPFGLILKQPDLGTALLVLISGLTVIYFAGLSWKLIIPPVLVAVVGILLLVVFQDSLCAKGVDWHILHDYQKQRVCTLLDPSSDPLGKSFHVLQGMIAIGSGGLTGKGYMSGTQTHLEFIPERTTDFIFTTFAEEFGLLGTVFLVLCYLLLIIRALVIALNGATLFSRLLAASMAMIFFAYAFVNMGMVSGILPVVGVPLPFVSYGGTAMATLGFAIGILLSVSRSKQLMQS